MPVLTWLRGLLAPRPRRRTTPPRPAFRPCVELLEDRLTPSGGLLDPTFGNGGSIIENTDTSQKGLTDVSVLSDGKLLAAGHVTTPGSALDFAAVRYNADGTRDTSFGSGGLFTLDFKGSWDLARAVAVQPGTGGKILLAGAATIGGTPSAPVSQFAVVRLNPNGTLDTSFGPKANKGKVTVNVHRDGSNAYGMAVLANGKFVLAGLVHNGPTNAYGSIALARFNANGTLDTAFGSGGTVLTAITVYGSRSRVDHPVNVAVDGSGRLVVAATDSNRDFLLARFNANGGLDTTFGAGTGVVRTDLASGSSDWAYGLALQGDGKIVVAGTAQTPYATDAPAAVARYNPDGSLDATFGQGGVALIDPFPGRDSLADARAVAVRADGKILLAGEAVRYNPDGTVDTTYGAYRVLALVRLNPDGTLDTTHGPAGTGGVVTAIGYGAQVGAMDLQPDGRAVVVGAMNTSDTPGPIIQSFALARFLGSSASPSPVQVGSFAASDAEVLAGNPVNLTAGGITTTNAGATITRVAFYYADANGVEQLLGYATPAGGGAWALTFTASLPPGSYTLLALAVDSAGAVSDPVALALTVL